MISCVSQKAHNVWFISFSHSLKEKKPHDGVPREGRVSMIDLGKTRKSTNAVM